MRAATEQTPKQWKAIQAGGVAGMVLGLILLFPLSGSESYFLAPPILIGLGVAVYLFGRVGAWWQHG